MSIDRRGFLLGAAAGLATGRALAQPADAGEHGGHAPEGAPEPGAAPPPPEPDPSLERHDPRVRTPVVTPDGATLGWRAVGGVKVFHLVAGTFLHEFAPGLVAEAWGYNGRTPGPTIEVVEGDRVRLYVTNRLPEATTVHWHGVRLPNGMDGVAGLNQRAIPPGDTWRYEFTFGRAGTFLYHPHADEMVQLGLGLMGMIVVHPRRSGSKVDRDFALLLSEWRVHAGQRRPDPREMSEHNVLTINSRSFPGTSPLVVRTGQKVRIRFGNLSAMHNHPMHLHGYSFRVTGTDGGAVPTSAAWPETTIVVPVGAVRDVEFLADAPGDWALHCHFTHHIMNQMGHAGPNLVGVDPVGVDERIRRVLPDYGTMGHTGMGDMGTHGMPVPANSIPMRGAPGKHGPIDMGGMFTVLKVRDGLRTWEDPGWYENPPGTVAVRATPEELARDGVKVG